MKMRCVTTLKCGILLFLSLACVALAHGQTLLTMQQAGIPGLSTSCGASNECGSAVALSADGNTAVVAARGAASSTGVVYVFTRSSAGWSNQATLYASDAGVNYRFGTSVSLSSDGNTAVIGSIYQTVGNNTEQGAAYVFVRSGTVWSQQAELTAADGVSGDEFGGSVSLSADGNTVLVSASLKSLGGSYLHQGAAYVFTRSGTAWSPQAELSAPDGAVDDNFGSSVSLSGDGKTALIGATGKNSQQGAAYVFTRAGTAWSQRAELIASDGVPGSYFGASVSLSGNGHTFLVGAPARETGSGGAAYLFLGRSQQAEIVPSDSAARDNFGATVALSSSGTEALVGAPKGTVGEGGAAYLFTASGRHWPQQMELGTSDGTGSDSFGSSVSLSGDGSILLIGAPGEEVETARQAGAAYSPRGTVHAHANAQTVSADDLSYPIPTTTTVTTPAAQWPPNQALVITATVAANLLPPYPPANLEPIYGTGSFSIDGSPFAPCSSQGMTFNSATGTASAQCIIPAGTLTDGEHFLSVVFNSSEGSTYPGSSGFTFITVGTSETSTPPGLSANNTFTGSNTFTQTITGSITGNAATASGLSCVGCVGNGQLGINYALGDSQGGNAVNADMLGGLLPNAFQPAGSYATTGPNLFSGDQHIVGNLSVDHYVQSSGATFLGPTTVEGSALFLTPNKLATASQSYNSSALYIAANVFNSAQNAQQSLGFVWQAEPVVSSNNTVNPTATLNLLAGPDPSEVETGLSINANGTINFAQGQTFPGTGAITGLTAGKGLAGGGSSGNVTLTNTGLLSLTAGPGLISTAGQTPTLNLDTTFTDARYLQLGGGTLTGALSAPSFLGNGSALTNLNPASLNSGTAAINITGNAATATTAASATTAVTAASAATATTAGNAANLGGITAADYARLDIGNSFTGDQSVAGSVNVAGNSVTAGAVTIGSGGTPIKEHLSVLVNPSFPALLPFACTTANFTVTGASDGNPIALGVPNARMNQGGHIVYTAWVSAANTVTVQACNIDSLNKQKSPGTGSIRIDVWMY